MNAPTSRASALIKADIQVVQSNLAQLLPLPDIDRQLAGIAALLQEASVQVHSSDHEAAAKAKTQLTMGLEHQKQLKHSRELVVQARAQLHNLELELKLAEGEERAAIINEQNRKLDSAITAYTEAAKTAVRQYERMMAQNEVSSRTQGAKSITVNNPINELNIGFMNPTGWQGQTSDHIKSGTLPWLNSDREAA